MVNDLIAKGGGLAVGESPFWGRPVEFKFADAEAIRDATWVVKAPVG